MEVGVETGRNDNTGEDDGDHGVSDEQYLWVVEINDGE
jgi:hypothetical protein